MGLELKRPELTELKPRITVIGVGGAGGNAVANMIHAEIEGVDFIVANTDAQALNNSVAEHRIQLARATAGTPAQATLIHDSWRETPRSPSLPSGRGLR